MFFLGFARGNWIGWLVNGCGKVSGWVDHVHLFHKRPHPQPTPTQNAKRTGEELLEVPDLLGQGGLDVVRQEVGRCADDLHHVGACVCVGGGGGSW